jgi:pimeloyl-ACP methyl ester carboxylesterase
MARNDIVIVLVPGAMGSSLNLGTTEVWNFSLLPPNANGVAMFIDPALLLPWLPLRAGGLLSVYDDFIGFLGNRGYSVPRQNLFLFPYDWRQGMPRAATALANYVNQAIVPNLAGRRIVFVTHSYGCMVARWALTLPVAGPMIAAAHVERVLAAGPPMLGIPGAFWDMLQMPKLGTVFTDLFNIFQFLYQALAADVQVPISNTLMAVTAQLEVLPTYPILQGGANPPNPPPMQYSAFEWDGWPAELDALMNTVQANLNSIALAPWPLGVDLTVFASNGFPTDAGYSLNAADQIQATLSGLGDDTVLHNSALAFCAPGQDVLVNFRHEQLLDDPITSNFLIINNII